MRLAAATLRRRSGQSQLCRGEEALRLTRLAHRFRICLWTLAGLLTGTAWGVFQFRGAEVIADLGFIGAFSGLTVGLVSNVRAHWFVQGALAGIVSGTTAGLLGHWLGVSSRPLPETVAVTLVGLTVAFVIYRALWQRREHSLYFADPRRRSDERTIARHSVG